MNGVGQAVTFLGMNTVRNICLQYMLAEAFKPRLATSQRVFDEVWKASAIASELSVRLGKALNLPDQGGLATQVVLGFVGHLATASLMPPAALENWLSRHRVDRTAHEQAVMDLSASEIGGLLLQSWSLPDALVADVGDIGRLLVTPVDRIESCARAAAGAELPVLPPGRAAGAGPADTAWPTTTLRKTWAPTPTTCAAASPTPRSPGSLPPCRRPSCTPRCS